MSEHPEPPKQTFDEYARARRKEWQEGVISMLQDVQAGKPELGIARILACISGELLDANISTQRSYEDYVRARQAQQICDDPNCQKPQCLQMRLLKEMDKQTKDGEQWRHD